MKGYSAEETESSKMSLGAMCKMTDDCEDGLVCGGFSPDLYLCGDGFICGVEVEGMKFDCESALRNAMSMAAATVAIMYAL